MDTEFVIPIKKEDLVSSQKSGNSVNIIDINQAWKSFGACKKTITEKGCDSIPDVFDILFSVLYESQDVSFGQLQEFWEYAINPLLEDFRRFVQEAMKNVSPEKRFYYLNILKMNVYICTFFIRTYEDKLSQSTENFIVDKKSKSAKSKSKLTKYDTWDWNNCKKTAFSLLNGVLQENLNSLWDPPVAEESFVSVIANCCYKAFENPEIAQAKLKPLKDTISQVLAVLVCHYDHGLVFVARCVQLLKEHEHAAAPLAHAVQVMVTDFNCSSVLKKVLRETTESVRDVDLMGFGKSVASFITNISETHPQILCPSIKILRKCLAFEPYIMRNAVLIAFTDVLLKMVSSDSLSSDDKKTRDCLLKSLHNHIRDQSSYVRSKALQLWAKLAFSHAIPVDMFMPVARTAKSRLTDSSSHVVKSAIQFFISILKDNIYAGKFNLVELRNQLSKAKDTLKNIQSKQVLPKEQIWNLIEPDLLLHLNRQVEKDQQEIPEAPSSDDESVGDAMLVISQLLQQRHFEEALNLLKTCEVQFPESLEIRCNMDRSDEVEYYNATLKKIFMNSISNFNPQEGEYEQQKLVVNYLEDTIAFALLISEASKEIERPLVGQSTMEAVEAIEFFRTAYQFSAGDSRRVIREIIPLVWSKTAGVKEAVMEAFRVLFIESNQPTLKGKAMQAAKRLIKLLVELDHEQKSALDELIHLWFQNNDLSREFIQVLWEIFSLKLPQFNESDAVGALIILDTISEKNSLIVSVNLQVLIDHGLKSDNLVLVEYSCNMISKASNCKEDNGKPIRFSPEHEVFHLISDILLRNYLETPLQGFMPLCSSALKMIYKTCWNPLKVSDKILHDMYKKLLENGRQIKNEEDNEISSYNEAMLCSLFYFYGEAVFRKWQYFDRDVFNFLKKQTNSAPQPNESSLEDEFDTENREAANDALVSSINEVCEDILEVKDSLDAYLKKLIVKVCLSFLQSNRLSSSNLQTVAVAALTKLMMMSSSVCENNVQVLVTIMEKSCFESGRANAVLGFGDLIMRFPNLLDPWTNHLYGRLKDNSSLVRLHTVVVLSHLITREMVKVRGQIAELCVCIEDPDPSISGRVRNLVKILSQKGNSLYNVVPDIISRLSNPEREVPLPPPTFNRILKYVLSLIGKERQNDLLVEKLCIRLRESTNETQWSHLSFCLSQLSYSERSLRKLIDCLPTLNERLFYQDVYVALENIFIAAGKTHFTKPHHKEIASEGLSKLEEMVSIKSSDKNHIKDEMNIEDKSFIEPMTPRVPASEKRVPRSATRSARKNVSETPRTTRTRRKLN